MNCPKCDKVLAITKVLEAKNDAITCVYCNNIVSSQEIVWKDGKFHFRILGNVTTIKITPRVLMDNQSASKLDVRKILSQARGYIKQEPNIKCICGEFMIKEDDISVDILMETTK